MAKTQLILESGGTKTDWVLLSDHEQQSDQTKGLHPNVLKAEEIQEYLFSIKNKLSISPDQVIFYGAGVKDEGNARMIQKIIENVFQTNQISVFGDLLGTARAGLQNQTGIAVILGTGSAGAYYNGEETEKLYGGLGFILGDEGSGAYLGKLLLKKWLENHLNDTLEIELEKFAQNSKKNILTSLYQNELPNQYLANFARFIKDHENEHECLKIIDQSFNSMYKTLIEPIFKQRKETRIVFSGSIAFHFSNHIKPLLSNKYEPIFLKSPIVNLIDYHRKSR